MNTNGGDCRKSTSILFDMLGSAEPFYNNLLLNIFFCKLFICGVVKKYNVCPNKKKPQHTFLLIFCHVTSVQRLRLRMGTIGDLFNKKKK